MWFAGSTEMPFLRKRTKLNRVQSLTALVFFFGVCPIPFEAHKMEALEILRTIAIFNSLPVHSLREVARSFRRTNVGLRQFLAQTGRRVEHVGVIVEGAAELKASDKNGEPASFHVLNHGQFFGEMAAVEDGRSLYDVEAATSMVVLLLDREDFVEILKEHPTLAGNVHQLNAERLRMLCAALINRDAGAVDSDAVCNSYIINAIKYINVNYNEPLTLDDISRLNNVSKYHFARRFKAATGHSFKDYLNRKRVEKAKVLIRTNRLNIAEACYEVGFNDLSYFGRVFKKIEGRTPTDYRKQLRSL
jgi:AraC-like DNA-binding protein